MSRLEDGCYQHGHHSRHPSSSSDRSLSPPPSHDEEMDGRKENESDREDLHPPPGCKTMMEFVCEKFPEARGEGSRMEATGLPGMQTGEVDGSVQRFKRAHPISMMMARASEALVRANESNKASLAKYPTRRSYKFYNLSKEGDRICAGKVNPELAPHISVRSETRVSVSKQDMVRLEEALLAVRSTQNLLSWLMGVFFSLALPKEKVSQAPMMQQLARSVESAMMHQIQMTLFAIAITRAIRRELYLSQLPPCFSSASRAQLR